MFRTITQRAVPRFNPRTHARLFSAIPTPNALSSAELKIIEDQLSQVQTTEQLADLVKNTPLKDTIIKVYSMSTEVNPDAWKGYKGPEYTAEYQKAILAKYMENTIVNGNKSNPDVSEVSTLGNLIKKYGAFPFVAFLGAILVGKEYYVLDAHFFMSCMFMINVTGIWLFAGPSIWADYVEKTKSEFQWWNDYNQMCVEASHMDINNSKAILNTSGVLREAKTEFNEVSHKLVASKSASMRRHFREEMINKLNMIKKREEDQAAEQASQLKELAFEHVRKSFANSAEDQQLYLELVLNEIVTGYGGSLPVQEHPVLKHLNQFFEAQDAAENQTQAQ